MKHWFPKNWFIIIILTTILILAAFPSYAQAGFFDWLKSIFIQEKPQPAQISEPLKQEVTASSIPQVEVQSKSEKDESQKNETTQLKTEIAQLRNEITQLTAERDDWEKTALGRADVYEKLKEWQDAYENEHNLLKEWQNAYSSLKTEYENLVAQNNQFLSDLEPLVYRSIAELEACRSSQRSSSYASPTYNFDKFLENFNQQKLQEEQNQRLKDINTNLYQIENRLWEQQYLPNRPSPRRW
jgi:chromosome segregation ATPase